MLVDLRGQVLGFVCQHQSKKLLSKSDLHSPCQGVTVSLWLHTLHLQSPSEAVADTYEEGYQVQKQHTWGRTAAKVETTL